MGELFKQKELARCSGELIFVDERTETVSARELHEKLEVKLDLMIGFLVCVSMVLLKKLTIGGVAQKRASH